MSQDEMIAAKRGDEAE